MSIEALRERVAIALFTHDGIGASEYRPTWETLREDYRVEWLGAADAVLTELAPELAPNFAPSASTVDRIRAVFRQACLYNHAADDLLCERLAEAVKPQAAVVFEELGGIPRQAPQPQGVAAKPYGYVSTGNVFYKTRLDAVRNGEQYVVAVYTAQQPQADVTDEYARAFHDGWMACRRGDAEPPQPQAEPVAWPAGVLNREATLYTLTKHNAWRRGAVGEQTDARMLGLALDAAIAALAAPPSPQASAEDVRALWGVVANAGRLSAERKVRWAHVSDATGLGSNKSAELCRRFERDPDELVGGSASLGVGRE
jgi:hypothetical protein